MHMKHHVVYALALIAALGVMALVPDACPIAPRAGLPSHHVTRAHPVSRPDMEQDDGGRPDMEQEYRGRALPTAQPVRLERNFDRDIDGLSLVEQWGGQ